MLRQSSSRNQRSKGLKLKKALQISLLLLVSVWLLYQVKHSYEKKAYSEDEVSGSHKDDKDQGETVRLGRKDLPPKMEADSSTLDERVEDEENDEMEQEMKHDENDDDPIDEQDLEKDEDLPEPGEHSSERDGDVGVFDDEERKERSQEDQEKSFHGDNVSSAVTHDPPSSEQDELFHRGQEKVLFVDDASTAVPNENHEAGNEDEVRRARERSFRGDDVSSSVDHDGKVTKPLPEEQLNIMDRIFEGTTNLSNGISFRAPGINGSYTTAGNVATPTNSSSQKNTDIPSDDIESKTHPSPTNLTSNPEQTNSTLKGHPDQQVNSMAVLGNQVQPLTNQTSLELDSPPNGTLALVTDAKKSTSGAGHDGSNSTSPSTHVDKKTDGGDGPKEDVDVSTKIMNKAISEDEVVPE